MTTKFIHILMLLTILTSCREIEEITTFEKTSEKKFSPEIQENLGTLTNLVIADSTTIDSDGGDPPVKQGGHWKSKN